MALQIGSKAPNIKLESTAGRNFNLDLDLKNKPCIIYFYPKDFTPGCTEEACTFRDAFSEFRSLEVDVVGISKDSIASHQKFKAQHKLPFELLSDNNGNVCKAYDALVPYYAFRNVLPTYSMRNTGFLQFIKTCLGQKSI